MDQIINLIIPFIALAIISVMIDKLTLFLEQIVNKIPNLPDKFEWSIAYAVVLLLSTLVCWQGDFRFFDYLNLFFPTWLDYLMTGLVISGGSAFVRTQFSMIEAIPASVMGVTASFKRMLPGKEKNSEFANNNSSQSYSPMQSDSYQSADDYPAAIEEVSDTYQEVSYDDSKRYSEDI